MNTCFCFLCIFCFISSCNMFLKIILGTLLLVVFSIIKKDINMLKEFVRVLIVACLIAINFIYIYVRSEYLNLQNGIAIAILLNCVISVYMLCMLGLIYKIRIVLKYKCRL